MSKLKQHYLLFGVIFLIIIIICTYILGFFLHTRPTIEKWVDSTHSGIITNTSSSTITIENVHNEKWTFNISDKTSIWQGKKKSEGSLLPIDSHVLISEDLSASGTAREIRVFKDKN